MAIRRISCSTDSRANEVRPSQAQRDAGVKPGWLPSGTGSPRDSGVTSSERLEQAAQHAAVISASDLGTSSHRSQAGAQRRFAAESVVNSSCRISRRDGQARWLRCSLARFAEPAAQQTARFPPRGRTREEALVYCIVGPSATAPVLLRHQVRDLIHRNRVRLATLAPWPDRSRAERSRPLSTFGLGSRSPAYPGRATLPAGPTCHAPGR